MRTALALIVSASCFAAQPVFDVASVRPASRDGVTGFHGGPGTSDPARIFYLNVTLEALLSRAFNVRHDQIAGPAWLPLERFDINAKVPKGTTNEELLQMLRNLLAERFALASHLEKREYLSYALTAARSGPKMTPNRSTLPPDSNRSSLRVQNGIARLNAVGLSMPGLAKMLSGVLDRPVVDQTGIAGVYDFTLNFPFEGVSGPARETMLAMGNAPALATPTNQNGLFAALENQIGLKLERGKNPVDFLIVDRISKTPSEN